LNEIDELNGLFAVGPPPLPLKTSSNPFIYPLATRWPRFFARTFDLFWETLLVSFVLVLVLGLYFPSFVAWINAPIVDQLFGILCLPVALILDALLYRALGNTLQVEALC
jgi:hypothetical protein